MFYSFSLKLRGLDHTEGLLSTAHRTMAAISEAPALKGSVTWAALYCPSVTHHIAARLSGHWRLWSLLSEHVVMHKVPQS